MIFVSVCHAINIDEMTFIHWSHWNWFHQKNQLVVLNQCQNVNMMMYHIFYLKNIQFKNRPFFMNRHIVWHSQTYDVLLPDVSFVAWIIFLQCFSNCSIIILHHFLDILVATRRCVPRLKDLTPEEIVEFFLTVCKCQRMLEAYYKTTSSTVTVQDGEFAGQTVKVIKTHSIQLLFCIKMRIFFFIYTFASRAARSLSHYATQRRRLRAQWPNLYWIE